MSFSNQIESADVTRNVTLTILAIIVIIGSLGNAIVIWVYGQRRDGQTSTFFIIVLAAADLQICILVVPFTMAAEFLNFRMKFDYVCKSYYFLNTSNTMFSCLLISAVALDRYLCICHPLHRILPVYRAKILVCSLAVFSMFLGVLAAFNVNMIVTSSISEDNSTTLDHRSGDSNPDYVCDELPYHNTSSTSEKVFFYIVQRSSHVIFISCILLVIIFYSFIYRVVLDVREKTKTLLVCQHNTRHPLQSKAVDGSDGVNGLESMPPEVHQPSRGIRESELFQNFRSAAMLFVVAVVYILVFTPALLMANGFINMNIVIYYLYYLNSASNPIIYCFMNSEFRRKLRRLIFRNDYLQGRGVSRKLPTSTL